MARDIGIFVIIRVLPLLVPLIIIPPIYPAFFEHVPFLLCGGDGGEVHTVRDVTHPEPGETAVSFDYYCLSDAGELTVVRWYRVFAAFLVVGVAIAALVQVVDSVRRAVKQAR